jgi:GTP-binding protein
VTIRADLRNIAIIAHVDHGKTTLVDAMLRQAGTFADHERVVERVMDNMDQERERGITIMAKNTGVMLGDVQVNIVDTPGHADFGGEVERTLHMVDGALLLVDAAEGPLPQTRFVLQKALEHGLHPILVINKCDRQDARPAEVLEEVYGLFIDLGATEDQLEFPVLYAVARDGWAVAGTPMGPVPDEALAPAVHERGDKSLRPLFDVILDSVPGPDVEPDAPLQVQVNAIGYDEYVGRLCLGRVKAGKIKKGQQIIRLGADDVKQTGKVVALWRFEGLKRGDIDEAQAGQLITLAGLEEAEPGDTLVDDEETPALVRIAVEEPTMTMVVSVSDGPFAGKEGKYVTSRHLRERLLRETRGNVALRVEMTDVPDKFRVMGRGELSLAVLLETMRREGYEMCVSRPEVVVKEIDGKQMEPMEGMVADVPETSVGAITEWLGKRGGQMESMGSASAGRVRVEYKVPTRGLIGFRNLFLTLTRGEGIMSTFFAEWTPYLGNIDARIPGAIVSAQQGTTTTYSLFNLQPRGTLFIGEGVDVYEGMVIGQHAKQNDIDVNPVKPKKLTNVRAAGKDEAQILAPPKAMNLEAAMEWIDMDELVEITPGHIRIRKRILKSNMRPKKKKKADAE